MKVRINIEKYISINKNAFFHIAASQSLMADCFIPLRFGCSKILLVGDPYQLPPTVKSDAAWNCGLYQSLYERLYKSLKESSLITMLTVQYRMHSKIVSFPNRMFYQGALKTNPELDRGIRNFGLRRLYYYNRRVPGESEDDNDRIPNKKGRRRNKNEADFVIQLCYKLIEHLKSKESKDTGQSNVEKRIAIISPYRAQVDYLQEKLRPYGVDVMTIDGSQGKERDFIIFSCVRSNDKIGFLNDERRLNVALTRAKQGLYIVGNLTNIAAAAKNHFWEKLLEDANQRKIISNIEDNQPTLPFCISQSI
jgi:senataxin